MSDRALRNVLFVTADQWLGGLVAAHGDPHLFTPSLDRLAAESLSFHHHYGQTCPCGPARTSLLTGMYAHNHRSILNGTPLDARHTNLALEARKAGYRPKLFGYTDTSPDPRGRDPGDPDLRGYQGVMKGFDVACGFDDRHPFEWLARLEGAGYQLPKTSRDIFLPVAVWDRGDARQHIGAEPLYEADHSDTAFIADRLVDFISLHSGRSWFAHAVFLRPHPPWYAPAPYSRMYDAEELDHPIRLPTRAQEAAQHPFLGYFLDLQAEPGFIDGHRFNVQALDDVEIAEMRASYYGLISEVDHHLGRIMEALRHSGQLDDTLVVFTADHGEMLGDHWLFGKGGYFDQSYHIPLIIRDPRREADSTRGASVERFTEAVDIMPTILDWLGREAPVQCDGESLLPFLGGANPDGWRREAHWEFDFRHPLTQRAERALGLRSDQCTLNVIRGERFKYVHFTALPPLLFDLEEDPGEFRNLADEQDYQPVVIECAQRLLSWRMNHAERVLTNTLLTEEGVVEYHGPRS